MLRKKRKRAIILFLSLGLILIYSKTVFSENVNDSSESPGSHFIDPGSKLED